MIAILIAMTASEGAVGLLIYYRLRAKLETDLGQRLVRTAEAIGFALDGRLLLQFRPGDERLTAYDLVRRRLEQQVRANGVSRAYVVDRDLRTLVDSRPEVAVGDAHYRLLPYRTQAARAWGGVATPTPLYVDDRGDTRLTALAPLRAGTASVVGLVGVDATPDFFAILDELRREMTLLGLVGLCAAGAAGLVITGSASRRLDRLRDVVARASRGDFTARVDAQTRDQIGALERDLDGLVGSVVDRVDYYESLLASLDIGLIAADLNGEVVGANAAAILWLSGGERLAGRDLVEVLSVDPELAHFGAEALADAGTRRPREIVVRAGPASGRTLAVAASPLTFGGQVTGIAISLSDVTQRRQLERQARTHERLAALGTMAAGLLHEIRTPLSSVMMDLDLLRSAPADPESVEVLDHATRSAERLAGFLVDFQIVAGLRPLRREWIDLCDVVDRVMDELKAPPNVCVTRSFNCPVVVHADRDLLEHAVRNLLANACEAMGAASGRLHVHLAQEEEQAVVTVGDTGPGIAPEALDRLFDPMYTTKAMGTGLGLTIVQRVMEAHQGSVEASNQPGGGALFTLRWPRDDRPLQQV